MTKPPLPSQKPGAKVTLPQLPSLELPLYEIKPKPKSKAKPKPRKQPMSKPPKTLLINR
jgi:hypothetical protein